MRAVGVYRFSVYRFSKSQLIAVSALALLQLALNAQAREFAVSVPAPEFTHSKASDWIGSDPLSIKDLKGSVLLIDFWTFDCWNCYRSFPWLNDLEARFAEKPFKIIGVHTPEFAHERVPANVEAKIKEFGLKHPVMLDNDFSYWNAFGNRYWPAFYLVDKQGQLRAAFFGETHSGDSRATAIESTLLKLLEE